MLSIRHFLFVLLFIAWIPSFGFASLQSDLKTMFEKERPDGSKWSIRLEPIGDTEPVFFQAPDIRLIPASCMKVITCAAILLQLGPDFSYQTELHRSGIKEGSVLSGDLIVVGSGDPSIGGRFNGGDLTGTFRGWAYALKKQGVTSVEGDVVGVDQAFDDERRGLNWEPEDFPEWYAAEVSALNFNDGCIDLQIEGGSKTGAPCSISVFPPTRYMEIVNLTKTAASRKSERGTTLSRGPDSRTLEVRAAVRVKNRFVDNASVPNPTLFFLTALKETFESEGIAIGGKARRATTDDLRNRERNWTEVATHQSPPLSELIRVCLKNSQNLYAEQFLKTLGFHAYGLGSYKNGSLAAKDVLYQQGCDFDRQYIADGSGLSRENRLSSDALVATLRAMNKSEHAGIFRDALPQSGVSGTLKNRMNNSAAFRKVQAKTGTLNGVRALSGFIKAESGNEYIFSMLANGETQSSQFAPLMDRLCETIAKEG